MPSEVATLEFDFDMIRPCNEEEVRPAVLRLAETPEYYGCIKWLYPEMSQEEAKEKILAIHDTFEFQKQFMHVGIREIVKRTSGGLTCSGFKNINPETKYVYISNHRDIFLDSGLLQILLFERGIDTTQITFGDNLMIGAMVDLGKVNKMFTVYRGGNRREMYENSLRLSAYIRHVITEVGDSVWIAQRSGRTKDGYDLTHTGVLKMLAQSGSKEFVECFKELNIAPLSISYEYEPCDYLKAQELHLTQLNGKYDKQPNEDFNSIIKGILDYKGRIHLSVTESIKAEELEAIDSYGDTQNDKIKMLCELIDQRIYDNFMLWSTNFIGHDILNQSTRFSDRYTAEEKEKFEEIMNEKLKGLIGNQKELKRIFLEIYANPVDILEERSSLDFEFEIEE